MGCCLNSQRHEVIAQCTRVGVGESSPQSERPREPRNDMRGENKTGYGWDTTVELRLLIGGRSE